MVSLGVPVTTDMALARQCVYEKRVQAANGVAARWHSIPLSMVGCVLTSKQQMANLLYYHVSFVPPDQPTVAALERTITQYVVRSFLPEDGTLSAGPGGLVLPHRSFGPSTLPRTVGMPVELSSVCT
jgi:hypothetical protein